MRQSTIFFIVAVLVLIWFGAEAFPGKEICVTSCFSLAPYTLPEQIAIVVALPILIVLAGFSQRRTENRKQIEAPQGQHANESDRGQDAEQERKKPSESEDTPP